ncbi:MAG: lasso peptide biosynthesis B2 protein [Thermoanaerobaculia bacterium]
MAQQPSVSSRPSLLLMAEAWLTLLWVRFVIRLRPRSTLRKALQGRTRPWLRSAQRDPAAVGSAVRSFASRHVVPMTCLVRGIAIKRMLERRALAPDLRIGFLRSEGRLHGHSWIELDGNVIADDPAIATLFGLRPSDDAWMNADSHDGFLWWFDG